MAGTGNRVISVGDIFQERYEVLARLSEGGFGEVFQAKQLTTGQLVAIKTLRPQYFDYSENQLARFRREVKLCATLHHPHIVGLIDFGNTDTGLLFIVFEFVPGQNLGDLLANEGNLAPREAARLMGQVLDAMSCAHHAGIIHRDLKPGNIMIMSTGARRNAKVLDFGIGAILPSAGDIDPSRLTGSFEQLGTPAYTAPEQLRGQQLVPASDLYAWGLVFLECLTGQRVVAGRSAAEIIHEQLSPQPIEIPPALQSHRLGKLLRLVTAKNVEQRQITTDDLLRQLEACDVSGIDLPRTTRPRTEEEPKTQTTRMIGLGKVGSPEPMPTPQPDALGDTPREDLHATAERRQITAVCCSIEIVADALDDIDFEDHDALMQEQQARCRRIVERFSGHVASVLGHQVLICYGYPTARADDARRAALSSLAIIEELAAQRGELERARGVSLEVRIGIHTGLVVAQTLQRASDSNLGNVLGNTPAVAARLNGLAAPGSIAISEVTRRLLGADFALEPLAEPLQGRAGRSMTVFQLGRAKRASTHPSGDRMGVALAGRDEELALLRQRWHQSRQGMGQLIVMTGEPGIGKSRLVRELLPMVQDAPHTRLEARCTPEGQNSALRPMIELLAFHLGLHDGMAVEARRDRLEALLVKYRLTPADYMPLLASMLDIPPGDRFPMPQVAPQRQKAMMLEAVLALVTSMASEDPVLLIIEDLHWADPTTIEFLSLLMEEVPTTPICVVLTARPEFSPPWRANNLTQIHLGRLEQDAVKQLVLRITGDKPLPSVIMDQMIRRTDGIPLFVEELTRTILESDAIEEHGDGYRLVGTLSDLNIPPTLRDSLMARLDRLGPAKATAQLAAVIGREFGLDLLTKLSPLDPEALQATLTQLVQAELIYRRRRLEGDLYLFKHALIQEIAYESLLKGARREYHARIAEVLQRHFPELAGTRPELLAHHHAGAQQFVEAVTHAERAGMLALQRFANAEAMAYMRQALTWLDASKGQPQHDEMELRCTMILIQALLVLRGIAAPEIEQLIERCQALVGQSGDADTTGNVLGMLCMYHEVRAHYRTGAELAQRYAAQIGMEANPLQRMIALRSLAVAAYCTGRLEEARRYLEQCIEAYDSVADVSPASLMGFDLKVVCRVVLSFVVWTMGYPDRALAEARGAVESSRSLSRANVAGALSYLAGLHHFQGEHDLARRYAEELIEIARGYGGVQFEALGHLLRCWANREVREADAILAGFSAFGQEMSLPYWHAMVAESEAATGQIDAAITRLDRCLGFVERTDETYYLAEVLRLKGDNLRQRGNPGDLQAAEECYLRAMTVARSQSAKLYELRATLACCRLQTELGRGGATREQLRALYGWFTEGFDTPMLMEVRAFLAAEPA